MMVGSERRSSWKGVSPSRASTLSSHSTEIYRRVDLPAVGEPDEVEYEI
jgi:hypothetical protein